MSLSGEFLLAAACCRWPLDGAAIAAIRQSAAGAIEWPRFLRLVRRHRVAGLVHNALQSAGVAVPLPHAETLAKAAQQIARQNLVLAAESRRLQGIFGAAGIRVVVIKGIALAQLAYGSLALKHSRDIDLLVAPDDALPALALLERADYALRSPAKQLSLTQRQAVLRYGREVELVHRGGRVRVELQWQLANNPFLLKGIDARSPAQHVHLPDGDLRTLASEDLYAYLFVHGGYHRWSRLKWLADLNALLSRKSESELVRIYHHAADRGAALCAGQALLLCRRLLGLSLPVALKDELAGRSASMADAAIHAMTDEQRGDGIVDITRNVFSQFRLGQGPAFFIRQCKVAAVSVIDSVRLPLPSPLLFLYPILRLPFWLWRRAQRH